MKNYILTGVTGVLGTHIFYELAQKIHENNYQGKLVLLIRKKNEMSCIERFEKLFSPELVPDFMRQIDLIRLKKENIELIDADIRDLDILKSYFSGNTLKYSLIHAAASVNLANNPKAKEEIVSVNYEGTMNLLRSLAGNLEKFSYIGTAFSYRGNINMDSLLFANYRNPYEFYKAKIENDIAAFCLANDLAYQILRPSIICGRLLEIPKNSISRFLVFYLFGAFFHKMKQMYGTDFHVRIAINSNSGLNLIPVDYTAKAICLAVDNELTELNIVNKNYLPNTFAIPKFLEIIGYNNFTLVNEIPEDLNPVEKLYYRTVSPQLTEYLMSENFPFEMNDLEQLMADFPMEDIENAYPDLCSYAVDKEFENILI